MKDGGSAGMNSLRSRILIQQSSPREYIISGSVFLLVWFLTLTIIPSWMLEYLRLAVNTWDSGYLLLSGVALVLINSARAISLYLGWFLVGEGVARVWDERRCLSWVIPLIAIPSSYFFISGIMGAISPHFGMPAFLSVASVIILHFLTREVSGWLNKTLSLGLFIFSFQWLDIMPVLTVYGAGWGELSMHLKNAAYLMEKEIVLNMSGAVMFICFFSSGIITAELLVSYSHRIYQLNLLRQQEKDLAALREKNLRVRGALEMQHLVHDLKRPLTTVTGLADVIHDAAEDRSLRKHTEMIRRSCGVMNDMISEILYAEAKRKTTLGELVDYTLNQLSPFPWRRCLKIRIKPELKDLEVTVNLIRISRALVNLIDNAHHAVKGMDPGQIFLNIFQNEGYIVFEVVDNGPGFNDIPYSGDSEWNSTGLGLDFVGKVMNEHEGRVVFGNCPERGAAVALYLPLK